MKINNILEDKYDELPDEDRFEDELIEACENVTLVIGEYVLKFQVRYIYGIYDYTVDLISVTYNNGRGATVHINNIKKLLSAMDTDKQVNFGMEALQQISEHGEYDSRDFTLQSRDLRHLDNIERINCIAEIVESLAIWETD